MATVNLFLADGTEMKISKDFALRMVALKDLIENVSDDDSVPVPEVNSTTMKTILVYLTEITKEMSDDKKKEYETKFCADNQVEIFRLIRAANYLNLTPLLDVLLSSVAAKMKGKTAEEMRQMFGIENDFTPEELAAAMKENEWVEDQ